jgi:hypothetical protein
MESGREYKGLPLATWTAGSGISGGVVLHRIALLRNIVTVQQIKDLVKLLEVAFAK